MSIPDVEIGRLNTTVLVFNPECPYCHMFLDGLDGDGLLKCYGRTLIEEPCYAEWNANGDLVRYPDNTPRFLAR